MLIAQKGHSFVDGAAGAATGCLNRLTCFTKSELPQLSDERANVDGKRVGFFQRGEVAARRHLRPANDVGIYRLHPCAWRMQDLLGKLRVRRWCADWRLGVKWPRFVAARPIKPERRVDRTGHPVQHHIS